jgi:multiple sugar transport system permease protein
MSTVADTDDAPVVGGPPTGARRTGIVPRRRPVRPQRVVLHVFLFTVAIIWLAPILLLIFASLRPYTETQANGYFSWPHTLNLKYYSQAWTQGEMGRHFLATFYIVVPAVLITLFLSSFLAFALTRVKIPFRKTLLIIFTAGNLLPPQIMVTPLYTVYYKIPLPESLSASRSVYDTYFGVILIHVAFQTGFCVFVLYNYMLTIPIELTEASIVDGASVWRQYWQVILPVVRPALGALATLEFTWIYNDFLWALVLMSTGDKLPITTSLNNLRQGFFADFNLLAAGSMIVALPTLIVFFALQRQFISGLTLGASKG